MKYVYNFFSGRLGRLPFFIIFCLIFFIINFIPTFLSIYLSTIILIPFIIRRLHDVGKTGYYVLLPLLSVFLSYLYIIILWFFFLYLIFTKSDKSNKYGDPENEKALLINIFNINYKLKISEEEKYKIQSFILLMFSILTISIYQITIEGYVPFNYISLMIFFGAIAAPLLFLLVITLAAHLIPYFKKIILKQKIIFWFFIRNMLFSYLGLIIFYYLTYISLNFFDYLTFSRIFLILSILIFVYPIYFNFKNKSILNN